MNVRFRVAAALGITLLLGSTAPVGAAREAMASYLPAASQYPAGYHLVPPTSFNDPGAVFGDSNAQLGKESGFLSGISQSAFGPGVVVIVSLGQFKDVAGAKRFATSAQTDVLKDAHIVKRVLRHVGTSGARYISGNCASCGPAAPTLGQVFFNRGPIGAVIWVQPTQSHLVSKLAAIIDNKVRRRFAR
jgi:hypothetical protein